MEVRTGKTITALTLAEKLKPTHVIFITSKKAIPSIEKDFNLLDLSFSIDIINYESVVKANHSIENRIYIIDEAHRLGQFPKPSLRQKNLKTLINKKRCILLSGTPTPESHSQIYHQLDVTGSSPFGHKNFYRWSDDFVNVRQIIIGGMKKNDYKNAKEKKIKTSIEKYFIQCSQLEAGFESEVEETFIEIKANDFCKHIYKTLQKDKVYQGTFGNVIADTPVALINKLSQLAGGTIIPSDELSTYKIIDDSKCHYIRNNYEGKRIAIYYRYKGELQLLISFFKNYTTDWTEFEAFKSDVFLSQIQSGREGISLKSADYLIVYNIDFSATSYWQLRARGQVRDKTETSKVHFLFSDLGIEKMIFKAVSNKKNFTSSYYARINNTKQSNKTPNGQRVDRSESSCGQHGRNARPELLQVRKDNFHRDKEERQESRTTSIVPTRGTTCDWL